MSRKWMVWVVVPAIAITLLGCPKKQPQTPPEEIQVETEVMPAPEEVAPEPPMTEGDRVEPGLPADVEELNRYLRDRGLIGDVYFDFDRSELRAESREQLTRNSDWLRDNPGYAVTIEGHCDERGTNEYNLALGDRRASSARDYLVSLGIDGGRMSTISYGEERPDCTESSESCWQRNRRAHFVVRPR
ncbi:MAG TPA: peptidoglycan-associated lipoprotein Pal [Thermoanaerobaculia bacterium]|nr:peptidoglycan-associated lipoprotein Pal [Thermoanaerobaculia bacterium]